MTFSIRTRWAVIAIAFASFALMFLADRLYVDQVDPYGQWRAGGEHHGITAEAPAEGRSSAGEQSKSSNQQSDSNPQQQPAGHGVARSSAADRADDMAGAAIRAGRLGFDLTLLFGVIGVFGVVAAALALNDWIGKGKRSIENSRLVVDAVYAGLRCPEWRVLNAGIAAVRLDARVWHGDSVQLVAPAPPPTVTGAGRLKPGSEMVFTSHGVGRFAVITVAFVEEGGARGHCFAVFEAKGGPARMRKVSEGYHYE